MKAKQVTPERNPPRQFTCVVCGTQTAFPYGSLRGDKCTCSQACNSKYIRRKQNA